MADKDQRYTLLNDILLKMNSLNKSQQNMITQLDHLSQELKKIKETTSQLPVRKNGWLGEYWEIRKDKS
tara:strand:+ start:11925 stop:12131 length:207 start_codon:yes stop_codon:yes gene_type:complete